MLTRTALIGLLAAAAAAILPAAAMATVAPSLAITQGNGATAGSTVTTKLSAAFTNNHGDAPKAITVTFPPGFLLDLGQNEGKCLASSAPSPSCALGYIKFSAAGGEQSTARLYLLTPPTIGDVAGIALEKEATTETAPVKLLTTPADELKVEFPPLPTTNSEGTDNGGIVAAEIVLEGTRLPTACGAPLFFNLTATTFSNSSSSVSADTPLEVTGCSTLPYAPKIAATVTRVPHAEEGSDVAITLTQPNPSGESATSGFEFGNPKGVKTNKVLAPCFKGATCTVGTVAASSPTLDSSELSTGELTLAGSITSGNLSAQINGAVTMSFPPPFQFSVNGPINTNEHTITFLSLPDFPLGSITYTFLGVPEGPAFVSNCEVPSTISATLTPQDGGPSVNVTGPVTYVNCPAPTPKPTASGSLSGLNAGKPKLHIHASHGKAENLKSLSIELPEGLGFSRKALGAHHVVHGLSLSGASIKSARVTNGKLVLMFAHPAPSVSLTARGPLLHEGKTLEHRAKLHEPGELVASLGFTDAGGHASSVSLSLN
jgi:hypothetical protein